MKRISDWAFQWKSILIQMLVNKLNKLYLAGNLKKNTHSPPILKHAIVSQNNSQIHLGVTFDLTLAFEEHS